jgi:hypothetical protein
LQFKKGGIKLSPCAKVQFFSDPDQVNLVHEFFAGNEVRTELAPLVLEYSRIWVNCYVGTNALVSHEEQQLLQGTSQLETAVISVPKEWQIACWLTDTLTSLALTS